MILALNIKQNRNILIGITNNFHLIIIIPTNQTTNITPQHICHSPSYHFRDEDRTKELTDLFFFILTRRPILLVEKGRLHVFIGYFINLYKQLKGIELPSLLIKLSLLIISRIS